MKYAVTSLLVALTIVFTVTVSAQQTNDEYPYGSRDTTGPGMMGRGMGSGMRGGRGMMGGMMAGYAGYPFAEMYLDHRDELNLTDAQTEHLRNIRLELTRTITEKQGNLEVAYLELDDVLSDDPIDVARAENLIEEVHAIAADIQIDRVRANAEARTLLTPAQRETADEYFGSPGTRRGTGGTMMPGRGMGGRGVR